MPFASRVVFVTGAGSGMGRLAAQRMADAGARVAAVDVNEAGLAETAERHEGIHTWRLDVTDNDAEGGPFCFPTAQTKLAQLMRRFAPGLVWSMVHRAEGRSR